MDWLRRNWPDLLIGIALMAVIAGIIITLLGGGSVFDFARSSRTPAPTTLQPREPVAPVAEVPDEPRSPLAGLREEQEEEEAVEEEAVEEVIPIPPNRAEETPAAEEEVAEELPVSPVQPEAILAPEGPVETEAPAPPVADGEPWRIGVGTFRVLSNAEAEAERFRAEGHPAFISQQGDLHVVLVGPFAEEAEARNLAQQFRDDGREAIVYITPTPAAEPVIQEAAQPAQQVDEPALTPAATADAEETIAAAAPAAQPGRYLQVGAYRSEASAEPQRQRLQSLGYEVTSRTADNGLIRLLVGPFSGDELSAARQRLEAQGIEYYGPLD